MKIALRYDGPNGPGLPERDEYREAEITGEPNTWPECVQDEATIFLRTNARYNGLCVYRRVWPSYVLNA